MELNLVLLKETKHVDALRREAGQAQLRPWAVAAAVWWIAPALAWSLFRCARLMWQWEHAMSDAVLDVNRMNFLELKGATGWERLRSHLVWAYEAMNPEEIREHVDQLRDIRKWARRSWKLRMLLVPLFLSLELRGLIKVHDEIVTARIRLADLMSRMDPAPESFSSVPDMLRAVRATHAH